MTLHFSIEYRTEWGQHVEVELSFLSDGRKTHVQRHPLESADGLNWKGALSLRAFAGKLCYAYLIANEETDVRREWYFAPRILPVQQQFTYFCFDHWRDMPRKRHWLSDSFQTDKLSDNIPEPSLALFPSTFLFCVPAPHLSEGERLALVGSQAALGNWDVTRAMPMMPSSRHEWFLSISAEGLTIPFEYKYVVLKARKEVEWESGYNRMAPIVRPESEQVVVMSDSEIRRDLCLAE